MSNEEITQPETTNIIDARFNELIPQAKKKLAKNIKKMKKMDDDIKKRKMEIEAIEKKRIKLEVEIYGLRLGIARIENDNSLEFWCEVGSVVEARISDEVTVHGKVEGRNQKYLWISSDSGRFTVLKTNCIGYMFKHDSDALNFNAPFDIIDKDALIDPE